MIEDIITEYKEVGYTELEVRLAYDCAKEITRGALAYVDERSAALGGNDRERTLILGMTMLGLGGHLHSQRDLIETLQAQVKELRALHSENEKAIAKLTGQVEVYKELPLSQLAVSMAEVVEAQKEILTILKKKVK